MVGGHPALSLHSSDEPGESGNDFGHDDSTINIVMANNNNDNNKQICIAP